MFGPAIFGAALAGALGLAALVHHYDSMRAERNELRHRAEAFAALNDARTAEADRAREARHEANLASLARERAESAATLLAGQREAQEAAHAATRAKLADAERRAEAEAGRPVQACPDACYALDVDGE